MHQMAEPHAGHLPATNSFAVAAETVVNRVGDDSGTNRVQIDVESHGEECALLAFHDDAAEAFFPEGPFSVVVPVVKGAEALFERLHEVREVPHPAGERIETLLGEIGKASLTKGVKVLPKADDELHRVKGGHAREDLVFRKLLRFKNFDEDMKVVRHDAVGQDSHPVEDLALSQDLAEDLFFGIFHDEPPVDDAGEAVEEAHMGSLDRKCTRRSHGKSIPWFLKTLPVPEKSRRRPIPERSGSRREEPRRSDLFPNRHSFRESHPSMKLRLPRMTPSER